MEELRLYKKLPISLRNRFWTAVIDTIDAEIQLMRDEIEIKQTLYDLYSMDYDRLIEISDLLGVVFDASINDTLDFLRREVAAIPFKIKYKSTAKLYLSFFKSLNRIGDLYIYYFRASSDALVRSTVDFLVNAVGHDLTTPYFHRSSQDFSGFVEDALKLDQGLVLDVENEGEIWTLDTVDSQISTNHLGLEYFIDRIITKQVRDVNNELVERELLMSWEYMDFIQVNTDFSRRVKEVPHIGAQLTAICDESKVVNPITDEYTIPTIQLKALVTNNYDLIESVFDFSYVEFGIGKHTNLPTKEGIVGEAMPTSLAIRVARNFILFDEKYTNEDYLGGIAEYQGQQINRFSLHDETGYLLDDEYGTGQVDGYSTYFQGTLLFSPIQKGNIKFVFTQSGIERELLDDKQGHLIGDYGEGTINYDTGQYTLTTDFIYDKEDVAFIGDGETTYFEYSATIDSTILSSAYTGGGVQVKYKANSKIFLAKDDGNGNIIDIAEDGVINSATIDYATGDFIFTFDSPIDDDFEVLINYSFNRTTTPDANTEIIADYYFTIQNIEITEAGLYDINDNLIAYSTFPPVEFNSIKNHLNLGFLIKKGLLTT